MTINVEYASDEPSTSTTTNCHVLAQVKWYGDHPRPCFVYSSLVVCSSVFDAESCASFIPISGIFSSCAVSSSQEFSIDFGLDRVIFAVPLIIISKMVLIFIKHCFLSTKCIIILIAIIYVNYNNTFKLCYLYFLILCFCIFCVYKINIIIKILLILFTIRNF